MDSTMSENAFFDALDEVFGTDDGYIHHLERIKKMKEENEELKQENEDTNTIQELREEEHKRNYIIADLRKKKIEEVMEENKKLKEENAELKEKLKKENEFSVLMTKAFTKSLRQNEQLREDIQEMGAEINKRCAGELMFHQTPDGENCLIEIG